MVTELLLAMHLGSEEYDIHVAEMEVQGIFLPSSLSLSLMNVFNLVEVNTPALFEKALRKQTPEEEHPQTIPIFSLSHPHLSHTLLSPPPPMDSLPSTPV
eukprot:768850-Rhodomonas_salina.1